MIFDPFANSPTGRWIEQWLTEPKAVDPFRALSQYLRAQAAYHAATGDERYAKQAEHCAQLVESIVEGIRDAEVDYDEAAAISPWERGTLKNKKPELDRIYGAAARGKVKLGAIPLDPVASPGVHALRAADHLTVLKEKRVSRSTRDEDADQKWAARAVSSAGTRTR